MRLATLLRRAVTLPPQTWVKNDLHDTVFFLRVTLAVFLGALYGVLGAQGLMIFLTCACQQNAPCPVTRPLWPGGGCLAPPAACATPTHIIHAAGSSA